MDRRQRPLQPYPKSRPLLGPQITPPCPEPHVLYELKSGRANRARLFIWGQAGYPAALNDLDDAPAILWALGDTALLNRPLIAMVGARNASSLGTRMARNLARDLGAAGYVVVSGLARGIDTAAHEGALDAAALAAAVARLREQVAGDRATALVAMAARLLAAHALDLTQDNSVLHSAVTILTAKICFTQSARASRRFRNNQIFRVPIRRRCMASS